MREDAARYKQSALRLGQSLGMNFTEKLKEILAWVASHAQRLSRQGMTVKNPLAYAPVYFYEPNSTIPANTYEDSECTNPNVSPIVLTQQGMLPTSVFLKPDKRYRLQVHDETGELLFTQDDIRGDQA
jgi:hypothetical protein